MALNLDDDDKMATILVDECRWRIQGAIDGGASAQEIADAAGVSNPTIYSYLGWLAKSSTVGSIRTATKILAVFGARVSVTGPKGKAKQFKITETIV